MTVAAETTLTALLPERTPHNHMLTSHSRPYDSLWPTRILKEFLFVPLRSGHGIFLLQGSFVQLLLLYYYFWGFSRGGQGSDVVCRIEM
ncbi:hypothetical protein K443DRAFT_379759 [Laccaria amethystina LaAM-08-1]|uniref:Unplaced genomic scaffold K443scaffold_29, whole genome shotgun sequence n=1 Tax=Laccaria amethystina LaAM-08-1 TaxID=1095629 RepID=A0A0C9WZ42_9AGAR|nr:hypothetical protein K443DRAFT_379759 [Laccaria amethystina LaAM-08-1]